MTDHTIPESSKGLCGPWPSLKEAPLWVQIEAAKTGHGPLYEKPEYKAPRERQVGEFIVPDWGAPHYTDLLDSILLRQKPKNSRDTALMDLWREFEGLRIKALPKLTQIETDERFNMRKRLLQLEGVLNKLEAKNETNRVRERRQSPDRRANRQER